MHATEYTQRSADWRQSLKINTRRTYIVIGLFCLIYISVGLLIDLYFASQRWPNLNPPLYILLYALVTLQIKPIATVIMIGIAIISLLVTFAFHDQLMLLGTEYREITADRAQTPSEKQLCNIVEEMKIAAGLSYLPKVFIINADYLNAFASGFSEQSAMIAVTSGLMNQLNRAELQAVIAHELSHIRHMDIRLTLMASVLANLTVMIIDMIFYSMLFAGRDTRERKGSGALLAIIMLLRYLLPIINMVLLFYLSRTREYMADAGCVELLRDNAPLASALLKIKDSYQSGVIQMACRHTPHETVRREAYIFDPAQAGFNQINSLNDLFSTHPSIDDRLKAIGFQRK